jgi:hypothetical protein
MGAIVRTVGVTPSNVIGDDYTKDEQDKIQDWQSDRRKEYKQAMGNILSIPGNIVFVHTSGRRAKDLSDTVRLEYRPADRLSYLTNRRIAVLPAGIFDNLPASGPIHIKFGDITEPGIYEKSDILQFMRIACTLSTTPEGRRTTLEGRFDQTKRFIKEGAYRGQKTTG